MTGGLAYLLRAENGRNFSDGHTNDAPINRDSVRFATLEPQEEKWLRRILRRHLQLTGSPRAAELLANSALPLLRVEPLTPPCSIEDSWASILTHLAAEEARSYGRDKQLTSERPVVQ
jgi:glutamate synthase domain-containing protein 3